MTSRTFTRRPLDRQTMVESENYNVQGSNVRIEEFFENALSGMIGSVLKKL